MKDITIQVSRSYIYDEVAKTTAYRGAKQIDADTGAPDRLIITDDALAELSRFWDNSTAALERSLSEMLVQAAFDISTATYSITLRVGDLWDEALAPSAQLTLCNFFIQSILGQWYNLANKDEADASLTNASTALQQLTSTLFQRLRPSRPSNSSSIYHTTATQ